MSELNGPEAREAFMAKVRKRMQGGVFGVDPCHGMVGGPAVLGPTLTRGWMNTGKAQQEAEKFAHDLNGAWAWGYEQALADVAATGRESAREQSLVDIPGGKVIGGLATGSLRGR